MIKKYTILILVVFTGINFNAKGIGAKGLPLAAISTGCITKTILKTDDSNYCFVLQTINDMSNTIYKKTHKNLGTNNTLAADAEINTLAAGAGILAGVAVSAALIRRDCNNYRQLMRLSTNALDSIKRNKLVTDLVIPQEIKHAPYFAQSFLDRKLRELYTDRYPYYNFQNDLHSLNRHLQNTMQNIAQANQLLYGSPLLTPVKKSFIGNQQLADLGQTKYLSDQAKNLFDDINFKTKLVDDYLKNANFSKLLTTSQIVK